MAGDRYDDREPRNRVPLGVRTRVSSKRMDMLVSDSREQRLLMMAYLEDAFEDFYSPSFK